MKSMRKIFFALFGIVVFSLPSLFAFAQATYPDKPVRYIIPFAPGGESDIAARFQQVAFKKKFGQEMIEIGRAHV